MLADPRWRRGARDIGKELRCLVCRNQSIDDSDADLAHDMRVLVRQRIVAGDSDDQVIAYIRSRYGDYVLLKPPFQIDTWLLWGGPGLILLAGLWGAGRYLAVRAEKPRAPPLSADEERRLAADARRQGRAMSDGAGPGVPRHDAWWRWRCWWGR